VCAARGEPQRTREVARLDDGTVDRYSSIGARVLLLGGQKSPPVITHDLFGALGRTIACVDAEIIGGLDHLAPEELQRSSQSACGTTCPSGNSESPHLRDCKPENGPVMSPQDQPITLAFVGYANAATAERASARI
jgi:hypothetical protein